MPAPPGAASASPGHSPPLPSPSWVSKMWVRVWNSISWIQNMADRDSGPAGLWAVPVCTLDLMTCCMWGARSAAPPSRVGVLLCAEWVRHSPALRGLQASRPHLPRQLWPYKVTQGTTEVDRARGLDPPPPTFVWEQEAGRELARPKAQHTPWRIPAWGEGRR